MKDFVGFGALGEALQSLAEQNFRKILVVASQDGWKRFNSPEERPFFKEREPRLFTAFSPNPDFKEILAGVEIARQFQPDLILAYGGGSPIDTAKGIKAFLYSPGEYDPQEPQTLKISGDGPPIVAITTTAGSGSEATPFAIFYVGKKKQSLSHPSLRPQMAVADPEMTYTLPPVQTASTGFDALSQGVESYWSALATPESREFAAAAIKYALPNLYNAVHNPAPGNRYNMLMSSHLSGKAITATRTTIPHGLAYHLTQEYGLPHGHAVALTVPYFFRINMDESLPVTFPGGREAHSQNMASLFRLMGFASGDDCFVFWRNLMKACDLAPRLIDVGVDTREKTEKLIHSFDVSKAGGHPVTMTGEYLLDFLLANP